MKYVFLLFVFQFSFADQIYRDKNGFVSCFEKNNQIYFLNWDQISHAQSKVVTHFNINDYVRATGHGLKSCDDQKYIQNIPTEILKPVSDSNDIFSDEVLFSVQQVSQGGRLYRSAKTPNDFIRSKSNLFQTDSPSQIDDLRSNYGDYFATQAIHFWNQNLFTENKSCDQYIGTCDFYLCQEQKINCGLDGYNLGFGFKYCSQSKFKLYDQMQTQQGQSWVTSVFRCLQKQSFLKSETSANRTCDQIQSAAYDSHPDCYSQAGFCELKISEKIKIFQLIKNEILSAGTIKQAGLLLEKCGLPNNEPFSKDFK